MKYTFGAGKVSLIAVPVLFLSGVGSMCARAAIAPADVLVVYNSQDIDALALLAAYLSAHPDIPGPNVFDLNDATLVGMADVSYTDYLNKIADPIKTYLAGGGGVSPESIVAICLIRGIPHRILDTDSANVGDTPSSAADEFLNGDATYASVDSELTLLFQDLYGTEAGGTMDSLADDVVDNPYHMVMTGIDTYSRADIQMAKTFINLGNAAWRLGGSGSTELTPGDIYLVCRIDGATLADAMAIIDRAQNLVVNRNLVHFLLDEHASTELDNLPLFDPPPANQIFYAGDDYEKTRDILEADGWLVDYDDTSNFISSSETTAQIIGYASFGENHSVKPPPPEGTYIQGFQFPPGAIFNTVESYNARDLNGLGNHPTVIQEQVVDFLAEGGTFGVGFVWEPFAFSVPDSEFLFVNFFVNRLTFAEAAYSSFPALSWQTVAVGDPLAVVQQVIVCDFDKDNDCDVTDFLTFSSCFNGSLNPPAPVCPDLQTDIDFDGDVDTSDFLTFSGCFNGSLNLPHCQ